MKELNELSKRKIVDNVRLIFGKMMKEYLFHFHKDINVIDLTISESDNRDQKLLLTDYGIVFINGDYNPKADWHWQQFLVANECHTLFKENPYLGDKCFLVASDGYSIDYTAYETWKEAEEAMEKAYEDSMPAEWDENSEEMSYCHGDSALLYANGEAVYSWEIIRANLECREKSMDSDCVVMMAQNLMIPGNTAVRIQKDLSSWAKAANLHDRYGKNYTESHTATFADGMQMDIRLCGSRNDGSGQNPLWTEAVLFDEDGRQVACTDPETFFFGTWELDYEGVSYRVDVIEE